MKGRWAVLGVLLAGVAVGACSSTPTPSSSSAQHGGAKGSGTLAIAPAPASTIAITRPDSMLRTWVLAGTGTAKSLSLLQLPSGKIEKTVPVSSQAEDVAESTSNVLAVVLNGGSTGGVDFYNAATGAVLGQVSLSGPAVRVASGSDGHTFFVLDFVGNTQSAVVVNQSTDKVTKSVPISSQAVDFAPFTDQSALWVLLSDGSLEQVNIATSQVSSTFATGQAASTIALSPDGNMAYLLRSSIGAPNAAVVSLATESVIKAVPAPAHAVDVVASTSGAQLFYAASSTNFGNVQIFDLGP